jgi:hypothetical protein
LFFPVYFENKYLGYPFGVYQIGEE